MWWNCQPAAPGPGPGKVSMCNTCHQHSCVLFWWQDLEGNIPSDLLSSTGWFLMKGWALLWEPTVQAHRTRLGHFSKQTICRLQNKHSEQIEKNYFGICRPPLRAFQQTCGFSEELQRPSLHQQVSNNFTCDLKAKVNSLGTTPQNGPAYTKAHIYVFLRDDLTQQHQRGLYSNSVSSQIEPCMGAPSFLLQSDLLTILFSASLPPAVFYLEISRLAWRCKLHRSRGK